MKIVLTFDDLLPNSNKRNDAMRINCFKPEVVKLCNEAEEIVYQPKSDYPHNVVPTEYVIKSAGMKQYQINELNASACSRALQKTEDLIAADK